MMREFLFLAGGDNLVHVIPQGNLQSNGSSEQKKNQAAFSGQIWVPLVGSEGTI